MIEKVKIEDIFDVARGGSPRPIDSFLTEEENGVNWIMIGDTKGGGKYIEKTGKKIRPEGVSKSRMVKEGDFLLTNSMSFGRPYIMKTKGCIHDGWLVLSPKNENIHTDYFYYYLGSNEIKAKLSLQAAGAVVKNLNKDIVKKLKISFPPLEQQKKIAAILDAADAYRQKTKALIAKYDELTQSLFLDMFGDPFKGNTLPLKDSIKIIGGYAFKSKDFVDSGIPLIKIGTVNKGYFDTKSFSFLPSELEEKYDKWIVNPGDILMSLTGTVGKDDYGNVEKANNFSDKYFLNQRVAKLEPIGKVYLKEFLFGMFRNEKTKKELTKISRGVRQANISNRDIENLCMITPAIDSQQKYIDSVKSIETQKAQAQTSLEKAEELFASLLQRAFKGELLK